MAVVFDTNGTGGLVLDFATAGVADDATIITVHTSNSGNDDNLDPPGGWTTILQYFNANTNITFSGLIVSGAAQDTVTWTVDAGSVSSWWGSWTGVGSFESGTTSGTNSAVNPPSKTASRSLDSSDMWLAIHGFRDADATRPTQATPTGYTNREGSGAGAQYGWLDEKAGASSDTENPGVQTTGATADQWAAATIALLAAAPTGFSGHWGLRVASWVFASSSGLWLPDHVSDLVDML